MANDVTFQREEYKRNRPKWDLVSDCCEGQDAIKAKTTTYLPKPNPLDKSKEAGERYNGYLFRSIFYNVVGRTLDGMSGLAFMKVPELARHDDLAYVEDDIDGKGLSIYQQSQQTLEAIFTRGGHGLLADYPRKERQLSKAEAEALGMHARIAAYPATSITNWRTERIGGRYKYTLIVLMESDTAVTPDGFGIESKPQYRVLKLVENVYTVEIWKSREGKDGKTEWYIDDAFTPTKANGSTWDEIPFCFAGAKDNDAEPDKAPLYDVAVINVGHYRNSAEYEDTCFWCGQIQPVMSGVDEQWVKFLKSEGMQVGSRNFIPLPEGADYKYVQALPNPVPLEAMKAKEAQMIALGAQLVSSDGTVKTAMEAGADNSKNTSVLALACSNVSEAYTKLLKWLGEFEGVTFDFAYTINQDFTRYTVDPQIVTALVQLWQTGRYPDSDLWKLLRKYGLIDSEKQDEEIKDELETSGNGLGLDDQGGQAGQFEE